MRVVNPFKRVLSMVSRAAFINGPYSLLVRASYYISCSVHARFASILSIDCK